jgi:hypothetical protein
MRWLASWLRRLARRCPRRTIHADLEALESRRLPSAAAWAAPAAVLIQPPPINLQDSSHRLALDHSPPLADHLFASEGSAFSSLPSGTVRALRAATSSRPVTITSLTPPTGVVTNQFTGASVVAVFTDTNPAFTAADFTATISWGDGNSDTSPSVNCFILSAGGNSFEVVGQHTYTQPGTALPFSVTVSDPTGASATQAGQVNVFNSPLSITSSPPVSATENTDTGVVTLATFQVASSSVNPANLSAQVSWGDGSASTFTIANGGIISLGSGSYQVVGRHTYTEETPANSLLFFSVQVSDVTDPSVQFSRSAVVLDAPVFLTSFSPPTGLTEGTNSGPLTVATFTDLNPNPDSNDFIATIDWGDGSIDNVTEASGGIVPGTGGSFSIVGSHTYHTIPPSFSVQIADIGGSVDFAFGTPSVNDAALTLTGFTPPANAVEGQATGSLTLATFTDANPQPSIFDYSATIAWGDGSVDFVYANNGILPNPDGSFSVVAGHVYADAVSGQDFSVTIQDAGGATTGGSATVNVTDPPLVPAGMSGMVVANHPFTATVATFSDNNPTGDVSEYGAKINWGDGHSSEGTVVPSGGAFAVLGTHTYKATGNDPVSVTITDNSVPATASSSFQVVPLAASGDTITPTEDKLFDGQVAAFQSSNLSAVARDFTASINWGDGETSTGMVTANPNGTFDVIGSHVYADEGGDHVDVIVADQNGHQASALSSAVVADAPLLGVRLTRSAVEGSPFQGTIASFSDANPLAAASEITASIDWDDGQTSTGTVVAGNGHFIVVGDHTYAEGGEYHVTISVLDDGGSAATISSTVNVVDAPLNGSGKNLTSRAGQTFLGTVATLIDTNPAAPESDFVVTIDWGNGDTTPGKVEARGPGQFIVVGAEKYTTPGAFSITVTIADVDGKVLPLKSHIKVT